MGMNLIAFLILFHSPARTVAMHLAYRQAGRGSTAALSQKNHAPYPYHPNIYLFAYPLRPES